MQLLEGRGVEDRGDVVAGEGREEVMVEGLKRGSDLGCGRDWCRERGGILGLTLYTL